MEHMLKAATVTATTEQGEFTAIAAAYSVDRVGDQIVRGAFAKTIARWRDSGKRIPLHWDHKGEAHNIIGSVDPATMEEVDDGLRVSGRLDIADSEVAREAWRSMKNGTMSLSFGYIPEKAQQRKDGVNELYELDLFEISIVPVPANPDTRILSLKSADADRLDAELQEVKTRLDVLEKALEDKTADETDKEPQVRSVDPLRRQADAVEEWFATDGLPRKSPNRVEQPKPEPELSLAELKQRTRDEMLTHLSGETTL